MPAVIERHMNAAPDVQQKLAASRAGAEGHPLRTIRCPGCGFYLLEVFGHDHGYIRVKCRKCKLEEPLNLAYFRRINPINPYYKINN